MQMVFHSPLHMLPVTMFHHQLKQDVPPVSSKRVDKKRSSTNMFLPWVCLLAERISLLAGSIVTRQSHANSGPISSNVSSSTDSQTLFPLREASLVCIFISSFRWKHGFV
jgi:hypothetical protein